MNFRFILLIYAMPPPKK